MKDLSLTVALSLGGEFETGAAATKAPAYCARVSKKKFDGLTSQESLHPGKTN